MAVFYLKFKFLIGKVEMKKLKEKEKISNFKAEMHSVTTTFNSFSDEMIDVNRNCSVIGTVSHWFEEQTSWKA